MHVLFSRCNCCGIRQLIYSIEALIVKLSKLSSYNNQYMQVSMFENRLFDVPNTI